jgi:hypothetical protein
VLWLGGKGEELVDGQPSCGHDHEIMLTATCDTGEYGTNG